MMTSQKDVPPAVRFLSFPRAGKGMGKNNGNPDLVCENVYSLQPCDHLLREGLPLSYLVCDNFVTIKYIICGQVWYLIVLISDLCILLFFYERKGAFQFIHLILWKYS